MKKLIGILMVFAFLFNGAVFADKEEIADEEVCRETIILGKLQIYGATQQNSAHVTRAEFADILVRLDRAQLPDEFTKGSFFDIQQGDADAAAIDYVYNKGYMTAENNKFLKNDNLTAEDAIKAIVKLLGYGPMAHDGDYLKIADSLGITKKMIIKSGEIDYRSLSALLYASVNTPMFVDLLTSNGESDNTILKTRFGLIKEEGIVEGSFGKYLYGLPKILEQNEVLINGERYICEDTELSDALGCSAVIWYEEKTSGEKEIFCYEFKKEYQNVKVPYKDLSRTGGKIGYEENGKTKYPKISDKLRILHNSKPESNFDFLFSDDLKGDVTFIFEDGRLLTAIAYDYKSYVVKSIKNNKLRFKYDVTDVVDLDSNSITDIVYIDGFSGSAGDIKVGDVISIAYDPSTEYRFLFVSTSSADGTLTGSYIEDGTMYYKVGGTNYPLDSDFYDKITHGVRDVAKIVYNQDYTLYFDTAGDITDIEELGYNKYMYGYITRAYENDDTEYKVGIKIYGSVPKGETSYELPERITFNGTKRKTDSIGRQIVDYYKNSSLENPPVIKYKLARNGQIDAITIDVKQTNEKLSDNYLTMPYTTGEYKYWEYYNGWKSTQSDPDMTYITYMHQWDDYEALCFRIPDNREDVSKFDCGSPRDMGMRGDGILTGTFTFYDVDEFNRPACIVYNATGSQQIKLENRDVIGVEKIITTVNDDDETCLKVCGYMHGKYVERMVTDEDAIKVLGAMKKGDFAAVLLDGVTNDITKAEFYITSDPNRFDRDYYINNHTSAEEGSFQKGMLVARVKDSTKQMISLNGDSKTMTTIIAPDGNYREGDLFRRNGGYTIYDCEEKEFIYGAFFDELQKDDLICASTAKNLMYSFVVLRNCKFENWLDIIPPNMKK